MERSIRKKESSTDKVFSKAPIIKKDSAKKQLCISNELVRTLDEVPADKKKIYKHTDVRNDSSEEEVEESDESKSMEEYFDSDELDGEEEEIEEEEIVCKKCMEYSLKIASLEKEISKLKAKKNK